MRSNWKELININMQQHGETFADVVSSTLNEEELNEWFDCSYGGSEGKPFTIWTEKRVYFPVVYDGAEWCESVSRAPDGVATCHVGGE